MSSVRLLRASSLLATHARTSDGLLAAPLPHGTKKLCPLMTNSHYLASSRFSSLSSFSSFSPSPSSRLRRSPFLFTRAISSGNEQDGDESFEDGSDGFEDEEEFGGDSENEGESSGLDSDDPFDSVSEEEWYNEQETENEEDEFELGGRVIPATAKPYSTTENKFMIEMLRREMAKETQAAGENTLKKEAKEFLEAKNNEELNLAVDELDQGVKDIVMEDYEERIKEMEELREWKIKENERLMTLPNPFNWTPDVNDTGPVYDPARSGYGVFPPVMAPVEDVADFYLRQYPSLYPFRDVMVYKLMMKVVEVNEWYENVIPAYSEILKRAKELGIFQHFSGIDDEESIVREIAASQGLTLEEWGNAEFQIKALKHQRVANFWDPPSDAILPVMEELHNLVSALEEKFPAEQRPIKDIGKAIRESDEASEAGVRFAMHCKAFDQTTKMFNIKPRQFAFQFENYLYPGLFRGHIHHYDWRHNPWMVNLTENLSEASTKRSFEQADRLLQRTPTFVENLNARLEEIKIPDEVFIPGENGEKVLDSSRLDDKFFFRLFSQFNNMELVELEYMVSRPKDTTERRCLNYLSSYFQNSPIQYKGERLYSDKALLHLIRRQKAIQKIKERQREAGVEDPFQSFDDFDVEAANAPDPENYFSGLAETNGVEGATNEDGSDPAKLEDDESIEYYDLPDSAYRLGLTKQEARHLEDYGISLEKSVDHEIDQALIEVEHQMMNEGATNIEDGFEWERVLTEHEIGGVHKSKPEQHAYLEDALNNRFPGSLLDSYRDHLQKDDVLIHKKKYLKKKEKNCIYCLMHDPPKLEPWNIPFLTDLLDEVGNIRSRRQTGFCPKHQRKISPVINRAKQLGFLCYKRGEFTVIDPFRPMPWKPVQSGLYPEDLMAAVEFLQPEDYKLFLEEYTEEAKNSYPGDSNDPVRKMLEYDEEGYQARFVPGNYPFKKRKQEMPQWGK